MSKIEDSILQTIPRGRWVTMSYLEKTNPEHSRLAVSRAAQRMIDRGDLDTLKAMDFRHRGASTFPAAKQEIRVVKLSKKKRSELDG